MPLFLFSFDQLFKPSGQLRIGLNGLKGATYLRLLRWVNGESRPLRLPLGVKLNPDFFENLKDQLRRKSLTSRIDSVAHLVDGVVHTLEETLCELLGQLACC